MTFENLVGSRSIQPFSVCAQKGNVIRYGCRWFVKDPFGYGRRYPRCINEEALR
jgi:hypothetical protein